MPKSQAARSCSTTALSSSLNLKTQTVEAALSAPKSRPATPSSIGSVRAVSLPQPSSDSNAESDFRSDSDADSDSSTAAEPALQSASPCRIGHKRRQSDSSASSNCASDPDTHSGTISQPFLQAESRVKSRVQQARERIPTSQPLTAVESTSSSTFQPANPLLTVPTDLSSTFANLNLDPWLVQALRALEIKRPTAIQRQCIPEILKGRNCIGGSRTGSGKTVAFMAPILNQWAQDPSAIYALILTPTRELAFQIFEQVSAISSVVDMKPLLVTGGADMCSQAIALSKRPHIVIATPGRLADHIRSSGRDTVSGFQRCRFLVLDEADRLLEPGKGSMISDVETCLDVLPPSTDRQTLLFTATVTDQVRALKEMPARPGKPPCFFCEINTDKLVTPDTLKQMYLLTPVTHRECYLHVLLSTPANVGRSVIIFCNRTSTATLIEYLLRLLDHRVTALHSGLPQATRTANLAKFRAKVARILVATDVVARGLDIPEVALVINFDVPRNPDDYIHRVGRTARAGRSGDSITMMGQRDVDLVVAIEDRVGKKMTEYVEEGVNIETRVVKEALKPVTEMKREALLRIEEGKDVTGRRVRQHKRAKV